jgi:MFS family permease
VTDLSLDSSYRALLRVPTLWRLVLAMQVARVAQAMFGIILVLFTLTRFGSPALAGIVTFAATFPGILVSPIAGALLDRHGRIRLVIVDYVVAGVTLVVIAFLAIVNDLPAIVLVVIAAASSLTLALSQTGLRSLFPILVPRHLWERANAIDSNGYVIAQILGPPAAGAVFAFVGGPPAMLIVAVCFASPRLASSG